MPIVARNQFNTLFSGYQLYKGNEGSAQLNLYEPLQEDLLPYMLPALALPNSTPSVQVKGYMISSVIQYEPLNLSSFGGYPQRFNLGGFRYLQSNRAMGQPRYIDTLEWSDNITTAFYVIPEESPAFEFPPDIPPPTRTWSYMSPLRGNGGELGDYMGHTSCDGFSYDLTPGVIMDFAFIWYGSLRVLFDFPVPLGVYFLNL